MVRPESWIRLAGGSPVSVGTGTPGSRPRFVVERRRAERGVESLCGGSKIAGRSGSEPCSLVRLTMGEPSRVRRQLQDLIAGLNPFLRDGATTSAPATRPRSPSSSTGTWRGG
jgi:hypothetical protein